MSMYSFRQMIFNNKQLQHISLRMSKGINLFRNPEKSPVMKNKSQYEIYEDDLNQYKNKNKSNLSQWNMLSSRLVSPKAPKQEVQIQTFREQAQKSEPVSRMAEMSRVSETSSKTETARTYNEKVLLKFDQLPNDKKSNEQLQDQLKKMREMLISLNDLVSNKLNKYELAQFEPKGAQVVLEPQKQEELLKAKIENNSKVLELLEKQRKQVEERDKQLEQKDYLIQLEESTNIIFQSLKQKKKQKHHEGVAVQKLDSRLIEMRDADLDDQYKMVKILKHNILYYFKKFRTNKTCIEDLEKSYQDLVIKDQKLTKRYSQYAKYAEQNNMLVKANRVYIGNKKINDEYINKIEQEKKKLEITKRSKQVESEKIQKEIQILKRDIIFTESRIQELSSNVTQFANNINDTVQKYQISNKMINKISYKFAEALLKDTTGNTSYSGNEMMEENSMKNKIYSRPKIKMNNLNNSVQNPRQISARYQTVNFENKNKTRDEKINDKNVETIEGIANKNKQFRIKPGLNIKRRNEDKSRLLQSSDVRDQSQKSEEINYKPKRFQKILSQRKDKESVW